MSNDKTHCLHLLKVFIEDSCNENKMELHIAYEEIEDTEKESTLGGELNEALSNIIHNNYHPDDYLEKLAAQFFNTVK